MIITKKRRHPQYLLESLLTILGWLAFVFFFVTMLLPILRDEVSGPSAPLIPPQLVAMLGTVLSYVLFILIGTILLIFWAKYNQYRFSGRDRRKFLAALSAQNVCVSFGLSDSQLDKIHQSQIITIHHEDDSAIRAIEILDKADAEKILSENIPPPQSSHQKTQRKRTCSLSIYDLSANMHQEIYGHRNVIFMVSITVQIMQHYDYVPTSKILPILDWFSKETRSRLRAIA